MSQNLFKRCCRLCLHDGFNHELVDVFSVTDLSRRIAEVYDINISVQDQISSQICMQCFQETFKFVKQRRLFEEEKERFLGNQQLLRWRSCHSAKRTSLLNCDSLDDEPSLRQTKNRKSPPHSLEDSSSRGETESSINVASKSGIASASEKTQDQQRKLKVARKNHYLNLTDTTAGEKVSVSKEKFACASGNATSPPRRENNASAQQNVVPLSPQLVQVLVSNSKKRVRFSLQENANKDVSSPAPKRIKHSADAKKCSASSEKQIAKRYSNELNVQQPKGELIKHTRTATDRLETNAQTALQREKTMRSTTMDALSMREQSRSSNDASSVETANSIDKGKSISIDGIAVTATVTTLDAINVSSGAVTTTVAVPSTNDSTRAPDLNSSMGQLSIQSKETHSTSKATPLNNAPNPGALVPIQQDKSELQGASVTESDTPTSSRAVPKIFVGVAKNDSNLPKTYILTPVVNYLNSKKNGSNTTAPRPSNRTKTLNSETAVAVGVTKSSAAFATGQQTHGNSKNNILIGGVLVSRQQKKILPSAERTKAVAAIGPGLTPSSSEVVISPNTSKLSATISAQSLPKTTGNDGSIICLPSDPKRTAPEDPHMRTINLIESTEMPIAAHLTTTAVVPLAPSVVTTVAAASTPVGGQSATNSIADQSQQSDIQTTNTTVHSSNPQSSSNVGIKKRRHSAFIRVSTNLFDEPQETAQFASLRKNLLIRNTNYAEVPSSPLQVSPFLINASSERLTTAPGSGMACNMPAADTMQLGSRFLGRVSAVTTPCPSTSNTMTAAQRHSLPDNFGIWYDGNVLHRHNVSMPSQVHATAVQQATNNELPRVHNLNSRQAPVRPRAPDPSSPGGTVYPGRNYVSTVTTNSIRHTIRYATIPASHAPGRPGQQTPATHTSSVISTDSTNINMSATAGPFPSVNASRIPSTDSTRVSLNHMVQNAPWQTTTTNNNATPHPVLMCHLCGDFFLNERLINTHLSQAHFLECSPGMYTTVYDDSIRNILFARSRRKSIATPEDPRRAERE